MSSEQVFCPYTGLRPFTEDESIYFKGRDVHIDQATQQLERNKFMIVTGASGDGKSSLVYAGILPNAKAGFLKATYSNWIIADFRPERTPMQNLSQSLARALELNVSTVQTELAYGFSALVDMYKASSFYSDPFAQLASEKGERGGKRQAANLIILADQFEEFFTNPENFHNGVPSQESASVANILLETARLALVENLPIYVVITMRSDYIGQCAAFRGLPGYIGFSQFFLPRLNRKELREVIEEPATLNGNAISRRLTERLIYDIEDGADQLPILQHALNQVWKMADNGTVEMDLIHYAMVGGMSEDELPPEQLEQYRSWFNTLPQKVQGCYHTPNLKNVLNTHADKLYQLAWDRLSEPDRQLLTADQVKKIIASTFKCLTKIDNTRAVRNRMTLRDICRIIDTPAVSEEVLGKVITIFRESGSTLVRPFTDQVSELTPDDVLDITHESLIRNWDKLNEWAAEEFASFSTSSDFETQLDRWLTHGKSADFLLSIGGLTYFEGWLRTQKFNAPWIARYLKGNDAQQRHKEAAIIEGNARSFLQASTRKHRFTRTLLQYTNRKTAIAIGLIALLTLTSFVAKNYFERQNEHVLGKLKNQVFTYVDNPTVKLITKGHLALEVLRRNQATLPEVINQVNDPMERIEFSVAVNTIVAYQAKGELKDVLRQSLRVTDSLMEAFSDSGKDPVVIDKMLKQINDFGEAIEIANLYDPSPEIESIRKRNTERGGKKALSVLRKQPAGFSNVALINSNLERAASSNILSPAELKEAIAILSPFGNAPSPWISSNYSVGNTIRTGFYGGFSHGGLYQQLAYLYAATGDAKSALQCIDTLLLYKDVYFQGMYSANADNASHIAAAFYRNNQLAALEEFVNGYCRKTDITSEEFYALLIGRCKLYEFASVVTPMLPNYDFRMNLSLEYSDSTQLRYFFGQYRKAANNAFSSPDELNFHLALSYKDEAILNIRRLEVASQNSLIASYYSLFDKAMHHYSLVSSDFLNQTVEIVELSHFNRIVVKQKFLFIFPDVRTPFHPNEPRLFHFFYTSQAFLKYISEGNAFEKLYTDVSDVNALNIFMRDYLYIESDLQYTLSNPIDYKVLAALEKKLNTSYGSTNNALLYLYLGHEAARHNDKEASLAYFRKASPVEIKASLAIRFDARIPFRMLATCLADIAAYDDFALIESITQVLTVPANRVALYSYASQLLSLRGSTAAAGKLLLAAEQELKQVNSLNGDQLNCRSMFAYAKLLYEAPPDAAAAYSMVKNIEVKFLSIYLIARGLSFHGNLYEAYNNIPDDMSDTEIATLLTGVYRGYNDFVNSTDSPWRGFRESPQTAIDLPIFYVREHN